MSKEFLSMTAASQMKFVKHNEADFESFKDFQRGLNERFEKIEKRKSKESIRANLIKWEDSLPDRWKGAIITQIEHQAAKDAIKIIDEQGLTSFYLYGNSGQGKTFLAYAILRRLIGKNYITPSQIKIISEETLLGLANAGFDGRKRVEELFNSKYSFYVFDNVASKNGDYKDWEKQLWEQLIDHIYSKDLNVIFTSTKELDSFGVRLSDSGDSKVQHLVAHQTLKVSRKKPLKPVGKTTSAVEEKTTSSDQDIFKTFS